MVPRALAHFFISYRQSSKAGGERFWEYESKLLLEKSTKDDIMSLPRGINEASA